MHDFMQIYDDVFATGVFDWYAAIMYVQLHIVRISLKTLALCGIIHHLQKMFEQEIIILYFCWWWQVPKLDNNPINGANTVIKTIMFADNLDNVKLLMSVAVGW